jgi:hypothetical protein
MVGCCAAFLGVNNNWEDLLSNLFNYSSNHCSHTQPQSGQLSNILSFMYIRNLFLLPLRLTFLHPYIFVSIFLFLIFYCRHDYLFFLIKLKCIYLDAFCMILNIKTMISSNSWFSQSLLYPQNMKFMIRTIRKAHKEMHISFVHLFLYKLT